MFILGGTSTGSALVAFFLERECCGLLVRQLLGAAAPCFGLGVAEGAGMIWWDFTVRNGSRASVLDREISLICFVVSTAWALG